MVNRGNCSFVTKSRNIARAGGKVALIIDTKKDIGKDLIMSDDGTGAGIRIPGILVGKSQGKKLEDYMLTASSDDIAKIKIGIEFVIPKTDVATVEMWYSSSDDRSLDFIVNTGEHLKGMLKNINFQPHFVSWPCPKCDQSFKEENCLSDGKYCALQHDKQIWHTGTVNLKTNLSGKNILMENLRQFCLYVKLSEDNRGHEFFEYVKTVHEICGSRISQDCHQMGISKINYNETVISECVKNSFESKGKIS